MDVINAAVPAYRNSCERSVLEEAPAAMTSSAITCMSARRLNAVYVPFGVLIALVVVAHRLGGRWWHSRARYGEQ